jgi:hypothetical protein
MLVLVVWLLLYLNARCAYRMPKGWRRSITQPLLVFAGAGIFILQVNLLDRFAPADARGLHFFVFVLIECGGALILMFSALFHERAKSRKAGE